MSLGQVPEHKDQYMSSTKINRNWPHVQQGKNMEVKPSGTENSHDSPCGERLTKLFLWK